MRRQVRLALSLASAAALGASCATAGAPVAVVQSAASRVEREALVVSLRVVSGAARGMPAMAEVEVTTRGRYHLNDDYPINFQPAPAAGVSFARGRIDRGDGIITTPCGGAKQDAHACSARVPVEFVAGGEQVTVGGVLAVSACGRGAVRDREGQRADHRVRDAAPDGDRGRPWLIGALSMARRHRRAMAETGLNRRRMYPAGH